MSKGTLASITSAIVLFISVSSGQVRRNQPVSTQDEAQREASKFWSNYVASCGVSHYVKQSYAIFIELRGFRLTMKYDPITEADRVNGVQAKGVTGYTATSHRFYEKGSWQSWGNGLPQGLNFVSAVRFQKVRGQWKFQPVGYFDQFAQTVNCGEIPGHRSAAFYEMPTNAIDVNDNLRLPIQQFFFWDSNTNIVADKFPQSITTFVNWKIIYGGTAFDYSLSPLESHWYKNQVQVFETTSAHLNNSNPAQLWTGVGWAEPGKWEVGDYEVKIFVRKRLAKIGRFQIVPDAEFSPELRFDGLYKSQIGKSDQYTWLRFYPDGTVLMVSGVLTFDHLRFCVNKDAASRKAEGLYSANGCDGFSYRRGKYVLSGNDISFSFLGSDGSRGALVSVQGTIGSYVLTLNYDVGHGAAKYTDHQEVFFKVD